MMAQLQAGREVLGVPPDLASTVLNGTAGVVQLVWGYPLSHTDSMLCPLLTGALSACKARGADG